MNRIGKVVKITGDRILVLVENISYIDAVDVERFIPGYVSVGALIGTDLVDGRTLVLTVDEIYQNDAEVYVTASVSGIYDRVAARFSFGTNSYPLVGEKVYKLGSDIFSKIFSKANGHMIQTIGTYAYDSDVEVGYDPNVLFGKHLGVFGNTGSGKTCTVVSVIQRYIRNNPDSDIKFIILDVNGEYQSAFRQEEAESIPFDKLRFHHSVLNYDEYGRLFRAAQGIQFPVLKHCIASLAQNNTKWDIKDLIKQITGWVHKTTPVDKYGNKDIYYLNKFLDLLSTMLLRMETITKDEDLMSVINSPQDTDTIDRILQSTKKVFILDLQVSIDSLDIVVYLLFKSIYELKANRKNKSHICLVLEEAHRYINSDTPETKLGNYYIDKLSREGRKFGIGLIISSQVPSMLDYSIVSQCNSVVMHKITSRRDREFLKDVLRLSSDTHCLQMSALEKQHAIVCGEAFPNDTLVRIHDASPLPQSNDPVIPVRTAAAMPDLNDNGDSRNLRKR